nr:YwqG family protein [Rothia dentocariosa]
MNVGHQVPAMRINTQFAKYKTLPVTASKIGGVPYLPKGQDGPVDVDGEPLHMIAQINCADLPPNSIYPAEGLLQFWISPTETDTEDYTSSRYDRVIYYPKLGKTNRKAHKLVITEDNGFIWPLVGGEYALSFEPENLEPGLNFKQYSTEKLFTRLWNERYLQEQIESPWDLDELAGLEGDGLASTFYEDLDHHQLGGVPEYIDWDPRDDKEEWKDYTINLLTLVSAYEADTITIMWGDAGVANWLITPEQLENLDFSKVFYSWSSS